MTKKILICDDEEGIRESLKLILSDHYELIVVDTPQQCLEVVKNSKDVGLVLMDIKMPNINGLDTLKSIKQQQSSLPVVMITGYKSVETAAEASAIGAADYIVKPFKSEEILKSVKKHLK